MAHVIEKQMAPRLSEGKTYRDMRELIAVLEACGKLHRVKKEVDPSWELSCMTRWVYQGFPEEDRFALLFEDVKGATMPVATALLGASREVYALALGTTPGRIHDIWLRALRHPIPARLIASGPVQEVVISDRAVDLSKIPVPMWTPGKDRRPCITACVITKDHDTGIQNIGTYRCQVQSKNAVTLNTSPGRQAYQNYDSYVSKGKPAPVAVAICCEPAVHLAASAALPKGVDEMTVAGGLKGMPIETVQAKTVDLQVPAHTEIVFEGKLHPTGRMAEDPFGEFAGYMGESGHDLLRPYFEVTCITHRTNPIYYGYISQFPPSESTMIQGQANECVIHKMLVDDWGEATVLDVALNQTHGGLLGHVVVQMRPLYPGHAKKVGRMVAEMTHVKTVTVVDGDIDIRYQQHLDMVMNSRVNPAQDIVIINDFYIIYDPSSNEGVTSKIVIDATQKGTYPDISLPPKDLLWRAYQSWKEADLPLFDLPQRVQRLLDFHADRMKKQGVRAQ
ncbi:MAG: UbiD family decarboxylase [Acidobacteria bacterium]|nr:UbiD family decarboxylase [Acidobacteriota bacterium]